MVDETGPHCHNGCNEVLEGQMRVMVGLRVVETHEGGGSSMSLLGLK